MKFLRVRTNANFTDGWGSIPNEFLGKIIGVPSHVGEHKAVVPKVIQSNWYWSEKLFESVEYNHLDCYESWYDDRRIEWEKVEGTNFGDYLRNTCSFNVGDKITGLKNNTHGITTDKRTCVVQGLKEFPLIDVVCEGNEYCVSCLQFKFAGSCIETSEITDTEEFIKCSISIPVIKTPSFDMGN